MVKRMISYPQIEGTQKIKTSKVVVAFSTQKADWPKESDAEMDAEIQSAWDLHE